jgi:hypothetical protein
VKTIVLAAVALAVTLVGCSAPVDQASRRDLPEAPLAADVAREPWRDPNKAPAGEVSVVLWWDEAGKRLTRIIVGTPVYAQAYYDDDEVRRIVVDKVRAAGGKQVVAVYARRGVLPAQAVHVANSLAAANAGAVRLLVEE